MADEGESSVWSFGWPTKIAAFFRPDRKEKTLNPAEVFLYMRLETFMWRLRGFNRPEMRDRMRERDSPTRGERDSENSLRCEREHGIPVQLTVGNRWIADELILRLWLAWSASWSDGPDGLIFDLVLRGHRKIGASGDVAQQDRRADCFKGWDGFGFNLVW
jgi:hypothetical protein